jgi:hypothetical protein
MKIFDQQKMSVSKVHQNYVDKLPLEKKIEESKKWIEEVTGEKIEGDFHEQLKDGSLLCKLVNKIEKNSIEEKKIKKKEEIKNSNIPAKAAFYSMQNITLFNRHLLDFGVYTEDIFTPTDLYENKSLNNGFFYFNET